MIGNLRTAFCVGLVIARPSRILLNSSVGRNGAILMDSEKPVSAAAPFPFYRTIAPSVQTNYLHLRSVSGTFSPPALLA